MKKMIMFLSACLLISLMGFSQEITQEKVPVAVKDAFAKKYPAATFVQYQMENKDYRVAFKDNGVGMSVNFNSQGDWLQTETVMIESDLPKEVLTSAATNFVGFVKTDITRVDGPDKVLNYEMNLNKGNVGYKVKFSPDGIVLKKTPLKK